MITVSSLVGAVRFGDLSGLLKNIISYGDMVDSRLGLTYEIRDVVVNVSSDVILYRPGMTRKLGMVEILQFFSGYFDERHISKAAPNLKYPYGIENAYGQKVSQQLPKVIGQLKNNQQTRRAMVYIGKPEDGQEEAKPCMQTLQFQIRHGYLFLTVFIRSWDGATGLPYDVMTFNGVNQIIAKILGVNYGETRFHASSLHIYDHIKILDNLQGPVDPPYSFFEVVEPISDFNYAREWAIDQLNNIDNWRNGLPNGIISS